MSEERSPAGLIDDVRGEQRRRWIAGDRVVAEVLLAENPRLVVADESALELVYGEVLLREERGELPLLEDFTRRFPALADRLGPLFEVHRAIEAGHFLDTTDPESPVAEADISGSASSAGPVPIVKGYEILGELGRGGMGVVYKARQLSLGREVALKMILAGSFAGRAQVIRFRAEAETVARVQHPNIVQIHDVGEEDGRPYFALELVEGGSLADDLDGVPRPTNLAARSVRTLAQAIQAAHVQGIVHRDLKPSNILLKADGTLKITDFGLAKSLGADTGLTRTQTILGTPSYMAPEQAEGGAKQVGPAVDLYALGAILYELLTGRPPFKAATPLETLEQVRVADPVSPSRLRPGLTRDVETICLKCLEKDPARRYNSAAELADELGRFLKDEPIRARPIGRIARLFRWFRHNPALAGSLALVALLMLVLTAGSILAAVGLQRAASRLRAERDVAKGHAARAEFAENDATEKLWSADLARAQAGRSSGRVGRRFDGLDALGQAAALGIFPDRRRELRDEAIACMSLLDLRATRNEEVDRSAYTVGEFGFDPRHERFIRLEPDGKLRVRRASDGAEILLIKIPKAAEYSPSFSPDGRYLAVEYDVLDAKPANCQVWDLDRGARVEKLPPYLTSYAFSPDSRQIVIGLMGGSICSYDLPAGTLAGRWEAGGNVRPLMFHPDGDQLAVVPHHTPEIRICDRKTGQVLRTLTNPVGVDYVAWRGDGRVLAAACGTKIQVWDMASGSLLSVLDGHQSGGIWPSFSHGGELLASNSRDGTTIVWDPIGGRPHIRFAGCFFGWCPDDEGVLVSLDSQITSYELDRGVECRTLPHGLVGNRTPPLTGGPWTVDFSPDGRLLTSAGVGGVKIYRAIDGKELGHLAIGFAESAVFDPDGGLFTYNGTLGLSHWPVRREAGSAVAFGPTEDLPLPSNSVMVNRYLASDRRGHRLLSTDRGNGQAVLIAAAAPREPPVLLRHDGVNNVALSPDGRWAATGTWRGIDAKVWDTARGILAKEWPSGDASVGFSPDGVWFVTCYGDAYRFYRVGSWEPGRIIPHGSPNAAGPIAFRLDGGMMAIGISLQHQPVVQLIEPATGREIAILQAPEALAITRLCFSPDGRQLAAATECHRTQLWDLHRVRERLAKMGLADGFPSDMPSPPAGTGASPIASVRIIGGDLDLSKRPPSSR